MKAQKKTLLWLFGAMLLLLLLFTIWCGVRVKDLSKEREAIRRDYSTVNDIRFGVLSVTAWRDEIIVIMTNRLSTFTLNEAQTERLTANVEEVLNAMITKANIAISNDKGSVGKKLRKVAVNAFVNWDDLRARVPEFADSIVSVVNHPRNIDTLKSIAAHKLTEMAQITRDTLNDTSRVIKRLAKYDAVDRDDFNRKVTYQMESLQEKAYRYTYAMIGVLVVFVLLWFFVFRHHKASKVLFALSIALALIVLFSALTSPMIEIDARIKKIEFLILGDYIEFNDQVLFYESKSILEVVEILIKTGKTDSMFVGVLILAFSVLFPVTKLISTEVFLLGNEKIKRNILVKFFAFKSGKWSMADVMVVAIFMSYVGFKGILDSQLETVNINTPEFTSIATNLTSLQPGFLLFLAFVIYGFLLSEILKRMSKEQREHDISIP